MAPTLFDPPSTTGGLGTVSGNPPSPLPPSHVVKVGYPVLRNAAIANITAYTVSQDLSLWVIEILTASGVPMSAAGQRVVVAGIYALCTMVAAWLAQRQVIGPRYTLPTHPGA